MLNRLSILGVPVDVLTKAQAMECVHNFLKTESQHQIATPNPEMLVAAHHNAQFREVLCHTALNIPDGAGILWAARRKGVSLPARVTGTDLMTEICMMQDHIGPVFLLGAWGGTAVRAAKALQQRNPALVIAGAYAGSPRVEDEEAILNRINASGAEVLFVAYGAPNQELWIARNLHKMPSVKIAMGVGGAFDFLAGVHTRAPKILRNIGLEWAWRLMIQPSRLPRIINAVLVFPWLIVRSDQPLR